MIDPRGIFDFAVSAKPGDKVLHRGQHKTVVRTQGRGDGACWHVLAEADGTETTCFAQPGCRRWLLRAAPMRPTVSVTS